MPSSYKADNTPVCRSHLAGFAGVHIFKRRLAGLQFIIAQTRVKCAPSLLAYFICALADCPSNRIRSETLLPKLHGQLGRFGGGFFP